MKSKKKSAPKNVPAHAIVFGFGRSKDEQSLRMFLQRFSDKKVLDTLLPRIQDKDILATVDFLTALMHKHLSEEEYHSLFLAE